MSQSNWLKRLIYLKNITFRDGKVIFNKVPMFIFPTYAVALLTKILDKEKNGSSLLYEIGYRQGKRCTAHSSKMFRFSNSPYGLLKMFCQHSDMLGAGKMSIIKADFEEEYFIIRFNSSSIAEEIVKYYGLQKQQMDHYFRGIWMATLDGIFNSKKELMCIETKCKAKGDPYCELVIKEKKSWDCKNSVIKKQIPLKLASANSVKESITSSFLLAE